MRFFPDGRIDKKRMREAQTAAATEIQSIAHEYRRHGWREASVVGFGAGDRRYPGDEQVQSGRGRRLTRVGLERLQAALIKTGDINALQPFAGVRADRLPVLPGGVAIMGAIFEELDLEHMTYADGRCASACSTTCSAASIITTCAMPRSASS